MSGAINDNLIVDINALPTPQAVDFATKKFVSLFSKDNALMCNDINFPEDGIHRVKLIGKDGLEIAATANSIIVDLLNNKINCMDYNGATWINAGKTKKLSVLPQAAYSGASASSANLWNNGARNGLLLLQIVSGTNSIPTVRIDIPVGSTYVTYKTLTVNILSGAIVIPFGPDAGVNVFVIPAEFRITVLHGTTVAFTYLVDLQLI